MTDISIDDMTDTEVDMTPERACKECGSDISDQHHFARYCPEHQPPKVARRGKTKRRESAPRSINVNLNTGKSNFHKSQLDKVEAQAQQFAQIVAVALTVVGQSEDAGLLLTGGPAWAASVRGLAEYEEFVRKMFSGSDTSQRVIAWVGFAGATAAMLVPIASRHGWLPDNLASLASQVMSVDGDPSQFEPAA